MACALTATSILLTACCCAPAAEIQWHYKVSTGGWLGHLIMCGCAASTSAAAVRCKPSITTPGSGFNAVPRLLATCQLAPGWAGDDSEDTHVGTAPIASATSSLRPFISAPAHRLTAVLQAAIYSCCSWANTTLASATALNVRILTPSYCGL